MRRKLGAALVGAALATGCVFGKAQDAQKPPATAKAVEKAGGVLYETNVRVLYCRPKAYTGKPHRGFDCRKVLEKELESKERPEPLQTFLRSLPAFEKCVDGPHGPESLYVRAIIIERGYTIDDKGTVDRDATGDTIDSYEFDHPHEYCIKPAQTEKKPEPNTEKAAETAKKE